MLSLVILIFGTFWEASMDIISSERNYDRSIWKKLAAYCDKKGYTYFGSQFWDYKIAWRNKWKNGDPKQGERFFLSSMMFAAFTDGWHVMKSLWLLHFFAAIVHYEPMTAYPIIDFSIYYIVFGSFHSLFFKLIQVEPLPPSE